MPENKIGIITNNQYITKFACKPENLIYNINRQIKLIHKQYYRVKKFDYKIISQNKFLNTYQLNLKLRPSINNPNLVKLYSIVDYVAPYLDKHHLNDIIKTIIKELLRIINYQDMVKLPRKLKSINPKKVGKYVTYYINQLNHKQKTLIVSELKKVIDTKFTDNNYKISQRCCYIYFISKAIYNYYFTSKEIENLYQIIEDQKR